MVLTRREFLQGSAGLAVAVSAGAGCAPRAALPDRVARAGAPAPFLHGVASGDPLADRVVLWTRVTPPPGHVRAIEVRYEVARDPAMREGVGAGRLATRSENDWVAKVDAHSLEPGRTYFYRFDALGEASPVGRTRTLPRASVEHVRFGVCSCSNYPQGYFNAYASLAERDDLDAVLHLGDYIYEYGRDGFGGDAGLGRDVVPAHEILNLSDYRTRYAQYRSDPQLQAVHRQHPFIAVWDDHEFANNAWAGGAENHQPATEGAFAARRAAALRAYFEWMPIRAFPGDSGRIYRSFRFGDLADLIMLDTRMIGRDEIASRGDSSTASDPHRTLLGRAQEAWLDGRLRASQERGAAWRVLGQQVMLASRAADARSMNPDSWDGYRASRSRLLRGLGSRGGRDAVILTGDYHSSWAMEVAQDPLDAASYRPATGQGSVGVEFVAPAISALPLGAVPGVPESYAADARRLPHVRYVDVDHNGFMLLDIDRERAQAEWYFERDVRRPVPDARRVRAFATARGSRRLEDVGAWPEETERLAARRSLR